MKRVFSSPDSAEVGLLRNILRQEGINCVEMNEQMAQTIPTAPFEAELWVENEKDYTDAVSFITEWQKPPHNTEAAWTCSQCGEELGSQFGKCWQCGTRRDTEADAV